MSVRVSPSHACVSFLQIVRSSCSSVFRSDNAYHLLTYVMALVSVPIAKMNTTAVSNDLYLSHTDLKAGIITFIDVSARCAS
jgi:hypothetical protein